MRKFNINVNGNSYEVEVEEVGAENNVSTPVAKSQPQAAPAAPKAAPKAAPAPKKEVAVAQGQEVVDAPMPGNIWKMMVKEGDSVSEGDILLILEAMKMENEIVAPVSGKVASVLVTEGATVSSGDKLVIIE